MTSVSTSAEVPTDSIATLKTMLVAKQSTQPFTPKTRCVFVVTSSTTPRRRKFRRPIPLQRTHSQPCLRCVSNNYCQRLCFGKKSQVLQVCRQAVSTHLVSIATESHPRNAKCQDLSPIAGIATAPSDCASSGKNVVSPELRVPAFSSTAASCGALVPGRTTLGAGLGAICAISKTCKGTNIMHRLTATCT